MSDRVRALEAIKRAKQEVCDVASGRKRWTMCVPVQEGTDTDRVLMNALTLAESALAAATPGEPEGIAGILSVQRRPEGRPESEPAAVLRLVDQDERGRRRTRFIAIIAPEHVDDVNAAIRATVRPTPTPETVERVARWIKARFYPRMAEWERLDDITRNDLLDDARAALRAVGEGA